MRRFWIVLSIVCVVTATPLAQQRSVRLRIADANSGIPLRAQITSASTVPLPRTVSDEHGEVSVEVGTPGRTIRISKPGYLSQSVAVAPGDEIVPIRLIRGAAISGRVIDMLGAPVVNRPILIARQSEAKEPPRIARTDDVGAYRVGTLRDGSYTVSLGAVTPPGPPIGASAQPQPSPDA